MRINGYFFARGESVGLDDEHLDVPTTGPLDPQLFGGANIDLVGQGLVEGRQAAGGLTGEAGRPQFDRFADRGAGEVDAPAIGVNGEFADGFAAQYFGGFPGRDHDEVEGMMAFFRDQAEDRLRVGGPARRFHPVVERLAQEAGRFFRPVIQGEAEAIGFVARQRLGAVGDPPAIGRIEGITVKGACWRR